MNKKFLFLLLFLLFKTSVLLSQNNTNISFNPVFGNANIKNDSVYYFNKNKNINDKNDSIQFDNIKFYITNIRFLYQNKIVFTEKTKKQNGAHLIDNAVENSKIISLKTRKKLIFDAIQFDFGIDSLTNASGAHGGDLDPTTGMYWAWQSGYINAKIEGKSNLCPTRKNEFQFHLGGYLGSNYALQTVILPIKTQNTIPIYLDILVFIQQTDFAKTNQIMSPSAAAVLLSKRLAGCFGVIK